MIKSQVKNYFCNYPSVHQKNAEGKVSWSAEKERDCYLSSSKNPYFPFSVAQREYKTSNKCSLELKGNVKTKLCCDYRYIKNNKKWDYVGRNNCKWVSKKTEEKDKKPKKPKKPEGTKERKFKKLQKCSVEEYGKGYRRKLCCNYHYVDFKNTWKEIGRNRCKWHGEREPTNKLKTRSKKSCSDHRVDKNHVRKLCCLYHYVFKQVNGHMLEETIVNILVKQERLKLNQSLKK